MKSSKNLDKICAQNTPISAEKIHLHRQPEHNPSIYQGHDECNMAISSTHRFRFVPFFQG